MKKLLSIVLAVALVLTAMIVPMSVSAEGENSWQPTLGKKYAITAEDNVPVLTLHYGESNATTKQVKSAVPPMPEVVPEGKYFVGWFSDPGCKNLYWGNNGSLTFTDNADLYAKYQDIGVADSLTRSGTQLTGGLAPYAYGDADAYFSAAYSNGWSYQGTDENGALFLSNGRNAEKTSTWAASGVLLLKDDDGAVVRVRENGRYKISVVYQVPENFSGVMVSAGVGVKRNAGEILDPAGNNFVKASSKNIAGGTTYATDQTYTCTVDAIDLNGAEPVIGVFTYCGGAKLDENGEFAEYSKVLVKSVAVQYLGQYVSFTLYPNGGSTVKKVPFAGTDAPQRVSIRASEIGNLPVYRVGYDLEGLYTDPELTTKAEGIEQGGTYYAKWKKGTSFENYAYPMFDGDGGCTLDSTKFFFCPKYTLDNTTAKTGSKSMKFTWTSADAVEDGRVGMQDFTLPIEQVESNKTYRIGFWYKTGQMDGEVAITPVTMGTNMWFPDTFVRYNDSAVTVSESNPDWTYAEVDITTGELKDNAKYLSLLSNLQTNFQGTEGKEINIWFDDVTVKEITGISLGSNPTKTQYVVGQELDLTGGKLIVNYADDPQDEIAMTEDMISGFDSSKATEKQTLTVKYGSYEGTFDISIEEKKITKVELTTEPTVKEYLEGKDTLNTEGGELTVTYNDGDTTTVALTNEMVTGFNNTLPGEQKLTVSYEGFTAEYTVTIRAKKLTGITVTAPQKKAYAIGGDLDLTGGSVTLTYDNDTREVKDLADYRDAITGFDSSSAGEKTITVTVGKLTDTFTVKIVEKTTISLKVTGPNQPVPGGKIAVPIRLDISEGGNVAGLRFQILSADGLEADSFVLDKAFENLFVLTQDVLKGDQKGLQVLLDSVDKSAGVTLSGIVGTAYFNPGTVSGKKQFTLKFVDAGDIDMVSITDCEVVGGELDVTAFTYGDVNGDTIIDSTDLALLKKRLAGLVGKDEVHPGADCNGNGNIDTDDLAILKKYLAGIPETILGPKN